MAPSIALPQAASSSAAGRSLSPSHCADAVAGQLSLTEAYELRLLAEVARWQDDAAFAEMYTAHRGAVIATAFAICGDAQTAEDIAQQTFTALWVRASRLVSKAVRLRPWLLTVARNAAHQACDARGAVDSLDAVGGTFAGIASDHDALIAAQADMNAVDVLAVLPPMQQAAVRFVHLDGLPIDAAAARCGISDAALLAYLTQAMNALREHLAHSAR